MALDYRQAAQEILDAIGGPGNVVSAAHCATRLRLVLADDSKVDQAAVDNATGAKGNFKASGQLQVIYGTGTVNKVYDEFIALGNITAATKAEMKEAAAHLAAGQENPRRLVADLLQPGDGVVLVIPIDSAAPKGRLILPQQQTIRDALEAGAMPMCCCPENLPQALSLLSVPPSLVITDSQAFAQVIKRVPEQIQLTSFSILMARYKGDLPLAVAGAAAVNQLKDGDKVLIAEGCTHHRQCEDIGTVKLPKWIRQYTGVEPEFHFTSGTEFPEDLGGYRLVVHCGACMLNEREIQYRLHSAKAQGIPVTNYGILIAYLNGILKRTLQPFPDIAGLLG